MCGCRRRQALDLDDIGSKIGERLPCPGPGQDARQFDDFEAHQRRGVLSHKHAPIGRVRGTTIDHSQTQKARRFGGLLMMAGTEGFEPSIRLNTVYSLSRGAPSATRPRARSPSLVKRERDFVNRAIAASLAGVWLVA